MAATDRSVVRVVIGATVIGVICYATLRLFGHSRWAIPFLAVVVIAMIAVARGMWIARRKSLESEARQREAEFLRVMGPKRTYGVRDTPTDVPKR